MSFISLQIQYIFSDKTGTLTENKMMFRRCTIGAIDYNHSQPTPLEEVRQCSVYKQYYWKSYPMDFMLHVYRCNSLILFFQMTLSRTSQNPPLKINPTLNELLGQLNIQLSVESGNTEVNLTTQAQRVHDFFMILAVCNTVVVAKYPHHDQVCLRKSLCSIFSTGFWIFVMNSDWLSVKSSVIESQ